MKREKQVLESKEMIKNALIELLQDQPYQDITISDIAEKAQVARMTVYRHFSDKEEIAQYLFQSIFLQVVAEIEQMPNPELVDLLRIRFRMLKESRFIYLIIKNKQLNKLLKNFEAINRLYFKALLPHIEETRLATFITGGIDRLTMQWLENNMQESPEEITEEVMTFISKLQH